MAAFGKADIAPVG